MTGPASQKAAQNTTQTAGPEVAQNAKSDAILNRLLALPDSASRAQLVAQSPATAWPRHGYLRQPSHGSWRSAG